MCTASFVPLNHKHYLLTHNRDERYSRGIALLPTQQNRNNFYCTYPVDSDRGGTWILAYPKGSICLLNGAESAPVIDTTYPRSRGDIPFLITEYESLESIIKQHSFEGYGPFTLIIVLHEPKLTLYKLEWDLKEAKLTAYDPTQSYIFSSTTLYSPPERARREKLFEAFIHKTELFNREALLQFHTTGFSEGKEGIMIDRAETQRKTVSVSSIVIDESPSFYYHDFINNESSTLAL